MEDFELITQGLVLFLNIILFFLAKPIVEIFEQENAEVKIAIFRIMNGLFFLGHVALLVLKSFQVNYADTFFVKAGQSLLGLYSFTFLFNLISYFFRKKFGVLKETDGSSIYVDTYSSRVFEIVLIIVLLGFSLFFLIHVWELKSTLETTGVIGVCIGFLALTNSIWAPDLYFGLTILSSDMINAGEIIQLKKDDDEYIVHKINFIYTILLNIRTNHRSLIRNSLLMNFKIDNLSKRAHIEGLRESLIYKIGYPQSDQDSKDEIFLSFSKKIRNMFNEAFLDLAEMKNIALNEKIVHEVYLVNAGDFALEYAVYFYLDDLKNTKNTKTARIHLIKTKNLINEKIFEKSLVHGVDLSTPIIHIGF